MTIELDRPHSPSVFEAGLPSVDYEQTQDPEEAHAILRHAREQAPIALGSHGPELLTYELVRAALRDERFSTPPGFILAAQGITSGPLWDRVVNSLLCIDGDEHHRLRRLVSKAFTPRAAARLRTTISEVINELVTPLTAIGSCDIVTDVAQKYPIPIICALLGTDRDDWKLFSDWTDDIMKTFSWTAAQDEADILRSWAALDAYLDAMIAARREHPDRRPAVGLDPRRRRRRPLDPRRTAHARLRPSDGRHRYHPQPGRRLDLHPVRPPRPMGAAGRDHPELAPNAVEEILRHSPIATATFRTATVDVELAGVTIPAGTLVVVNSACANRDPAVYDDPDRLDITRVAPSAMLTFGGGVHYCLGSHLARAELVEALIVMTRRMPNVRRTGPAPWKPLTGISGPITLPIEFDTGH